MEDNLTRKENHDNMLLLILGGCVIMTNVILDFIDSNVFKILNFVATFTILFAFAWFKLILLDEYVHSFWLKERMKRKVECIYGYGIDEYFVLARLSFLTGILVLMIIILNGVDVLSGVFSSWSLVIEGCISSVFISIYGIQLSKYESAFGSREIVIPFVSSCMGLLMTSMFVWYSRMLSVLFLFFAYCFIICSNEIRSITKTLEWGDHAIVRIGDALFDSKELQFYLIFYSKTDIEVWWIEKRLLKYAKMDEIVSIERIPQPSDYTKGAQTVIPVWRMVVEWFMGLRIFR